MPATSSSVPAAGVQRTTELQRPYYSYYTQCLANAEVYRSNCYQKCTTYCFYCDQQSDGYIQQCGIQYSQDIQYCQTGYDASMATCWENYNNCQANCTNNLANLSSLSGEVASIWNPSRAASAACVDVNTTERASAIARLSAEP